MSEEVTLRDYIDLRIQNVESKLDAQSAFNAQHFQLNELAIAKAEESMTNRLEGMNEFRSQIKEERANYATRQNCDSTHKPLEERIKALERSNAFSAGKMWMAMAVFAAVPTILALIAIFRK